MNSRLLPSLLAVVLLWGCGLKGDLYIPEPESDGETQTLESDAAAEDAETDTGDGRED